MMPTSPLNCAACGAAIQPQARLCIACGQLLPASTEDTDLASPVLVEPLVPPALLVGRYHLIGMIGKGGFGAVYKAEDEKRNNVLVAIKEINLSGLSSREVIEATDTFNREVRLLSGLAHPNLPRISEHFTDAEHWYLVMDFIEGETLEEYLESTKGGHLPVAEVLDIGLQLCTVLSYLHTRQPSIIFRDVKPANVMRTAAGQLYLIDFGIARHFTPGQSRDTNALGSPGYAAPEQYGKAQTTAQSDIYSLGATLQSLLTGKDPLEPISGSLYAEDVPEELELLLVQMLDTDTEKRPASMGSVKWTLQWIQDEQRSLPPRVLPAHQSLQPLGYAIQQRHSRPGPPPPPRLYGGAILVSALCCLLTFALVVAGFYYGFEGTYCKPWCYGNGLPIFSGTGFALLVLSILSASFALAQAKERRDVPIPIGCLVISIIGLPLFWGVFYLLLAGFACTG